MIDSHHHVWRLARGDYDWITPQLEVLYRDFELSDLQPELQRAGISKTVLVQATPSIAETRFILELANQSEFVAGVVGWVDMEAADAAEMIADLARDPYLKGIRPMIQEIEDVDWMLQPELDKAFQALLQHKLRFDALVFPRHLKNLDILIRRYPELPMVVDHGAKPEIRNNLFDEWASDIRTLSAHSHICCKLSGLVTEANQDWNIDTLQPYVDHLVNCFGPQRLMWGSDWPVVLLTASYQGWREATQSLLADLGEDEREAILGGVARRFYGL